MVYHRPLSSVYGDNYRYGSSLYPYYYYPMMDDVERRYRNTLSRTAVRSDRGDLGLYSFAGSHIHGGRQPADRGSMPVIGGVKGAPKGSYDLYAPLGPDYGRKYLRATSPEPRPKSAGFKPDYYYPDDLSYRTYPSKISTDYDPDLKRTTTTTTTTERWVPLTTYIYHTPYHSYYYRSSPYASYTYRTDDGLYSYDYLDDYKRTTKTTTTRSKNIDALDLSYSKSVDYNQYMQKCTTIQSELEQVKNMVSDAESRIKSEVVFNRNKMQNDLADIAMVIDETARYNEDLHRIIKKQSKHLNEVNKLYEETNRHLGEVSDTLEKSRVRCQSLQTDISSVQTGLELTMKRRI